MGNDFEKMMAKAVEMRKKYSETNPREWGVEQVFMGLIKDVGDLSRMLMVDGGYRNDLDKDVKSAIGHELADIFYSIMVIADKTGVDLEKSFWDNMKNIEEKLKDK